VAFPAVTRPVGPGRYRRRMAEDRRTGEPLTASQRLAAALGRPVPRKLTPAEAEAFEAAQDQADAEAERIWGVRGRSAV